MLHKLTIFSLSLFSSFVLNAQPVCHCGNSSSPINDSTSYSYAYFQCDTTPFSNHSALYKQFNCDSLWISFKTPSGKMKLLFSSDINSDMFVEELKFMPHFMQEYDSVLLFGRQQVSAIDYPLSYTLLNKTTGVWEKELGELIYYSENAEPGFVMLTPEKPKNSITVYFVDKRKHFTITIPKGRSLATENFWESAFEEPVIDGTRVSVKYTYRIAGDSHQIKSGVLKFDLAKYIH